ncbi:MAG: D-alanine--D-alanine ligase A [Planctomycetes bacterium]|nr:D-alanine--D-alanine ligase A [Planctomycetota bacterium]
MTSPALPLAVLFGGPSEEHEISLRSARTVVEHLNPARYEVHLVGITREGGWLGPEASRRLLYGEDPGEAGGPPALPAGTACVFPVLHGPFGEDGRVQGWLELLGVPCVGSGSVGSQLAIDKVLTKLVLRGNGLPIIPWSEVDRRRWSEDRSAALTEAARHGFPCFVKPNRLGSSVGISRVEHADELAAAIEAALEHDALVVIEPEIPGREIEVAVLEGETLQVSEPGEIALDGWYDYAAKYETDAAELKVPADELHPATVARLKSLSAEAFRLLRMSGMARVDFRILDKQVGYESAGRIYINEVNSIPGFTSISMYPKLFDLAGIGLPHLLDELVQAALRQAAAPQPRAAKAQV